MVQDRKGDRKEDRDMDVYTVAVWIGVFVFGWLLGREHAGKG